MAQARMLLRAVLPQPRFDPAGVLALVRYQQSRAAAAYESHRKRQLLRLDRLQSQLSL